MVILEKIEALVIFFKFKVNKILRFMETAILRFLLL